MNSKIIRNVFDRHLRPTRELDRFLFELSTVPSSLLSQRTPPASHDEALQICPQLWGKNPFATDRYADMALERQAMRDLLGKL